MMVFRDDHPILVYNAGHHYFLARNRLPEDPGHIFYHWKFIPACYLSHFRSALFSFRARSSRARSTFSGVTGKSIIHRPVALWIALTIAGMGELAVISPTPLTPNGPSTEG